MNVSHAIHEAGLKPVLFHSGLALLPIVAILCGVAVGLGTVALGVVLLVRGRTHEEESEGLDSRRPGEKLCLLYVLLISNFNIISPSHLHDKKDWGGGIFKQSFKRGQLKDFF